MAKKLNSMPDHKANLPRNPHDLSQSLSYTTVPGQISPVYFDMLHSGDEIFFRGAQFTRLNPLEKPPLGQIDVHIDYFFVPLTVLYLPSSSMFYQTDDLVSSLIDKSNLIKDKFPTVDMNAFINATFAISGEGDGRFGIWKDQPIFDEHGNIGYEEPFDCTGKSIFRLFDFLDMNPQCIYDRMHNGPISDYPRITPWFALAYQAIYQLFYRNDDREFKNYHYNIDKFYNTPTIVPGDAEETKSIFQINYVSRPKDYFNSVKSNPIGSAVSSLSGSTLTSLYRSVNSWLNDRTVESSDNAGIQTSYGQSLTVQSSVILGEDGTITSNAIRQLFMVDKLLRIVGRAEKNYESQFLAHFGIKIPHDVMHNITHIGHDMVSMNAESVISKADTFNTGTGDGSALGEVGGQASCILKHEGKDFHFKAPFHGVFMAVSYIVPRRRYVTGLNKLHSLNSPSDFYQPEFDKKGMQPLFYYEANPVYLGATDFVGWQFGYEHFKRKYDRVTTAFMPTLNSSISVNTLSPWIVSNRPYCFLDNDCQIQDYPDKMSMSLLCAPTDLNVNMIVPYNTNFVNAFIDLEYFSPWLLYQTDPFICDFNMHLKKVNSMSEYSEPEL